METLQQKLRKYFIMGSQDCNRDPEKILTEAIEAGITAFQYREKGANALTGKQQIELGKRLRDICYEHDIVFIVNDDVNLVEPLQADGIHVGQSDTPVEKVRERFPNKWIGLSVSNIEEVNRSPIDLVDYVGAGPIFETPTKPDKKPVGVEWIKTLRKQFPHLPIVGIGGMNTTNAASVIDAGADGVSFISAVTKAKNIQQAVAGL
ncbi:MAG TPA: thiamine phosphate synthase [Bacillota bacterium]